MRWVYTLTLKTLPACTLTRAPLIPQCQAAATPPTAFYAPSGRHLPVPSSPPGVERLVGGDPRGVSGQAGSGSGLRSLVCRCGRPSHGLDRVALRGLGGSPRGGWAEDHSELPHQKGTGWGSWWPRPSRPAILYPGPGSGRSSQWDATNTVRAITRGAGRLQVTSRQGPEGLKPGLGPASHPATQMLAFL